MKVAKITFIGAGSLGFTNKLARDILNFPLLKDARLGFRHHGDIRWGIADKVVFGKTLWDQSEVE